MRSYFLIAIALLIVSSCTKRDLVSSPNSFEVTTDKASYTAGDTVRFLIKGSAENIVLWSGLPGAVYANRTRTFAEGNVLTLDFGSFSQYGVVDTDNIQLLVSTDFNGIYDHENVQAATWDNISSRAAWSDGTDRFPSGDVDISDYAAANKDMAVALRYVTSEVQPLGSQNRWVFRSFNIKNTSPDGAVTSIATMSTAGWKAVDFADDTKAWQISSVQLIANRSDTELQDDWVITKTFNPNKVSPDRGLPIKNISNSVTEFAVVYPKEGSYSVTFVASNASYENQETIVKELTLTVNP